MCCAVYQPTLVKNFFSSLVSKFTFSCSAIYIFSHHNTNTRTRTAQYTKLLSVFYSFYLFGVCCTSNDAAAQYIFMICLTHNDPNVTQIPVFRFSLQLITHQFPCVSFDFSSFRVRTNARARIRTTQYFLFCDVICYCASVCSQK